jgi:hypothetical protein
MCSVVGKTHLLNLRYVLCSVQNTFTELSVCVVYRAEHIYGTSGMCCVVCRTHLVNRRYVLCTV